MEAGKEQRISKLPVLSLGEAPGHSPEEVSGKIIYRNHRSKGQPRPPLHFSPESLRAKGRVRQMLPELITSTPWALLTYPTPSPPFLRATAQYLERETEAQRCKVVV